MKIVKNIFVFVFELILTVGIVVFIISNLINSTILSKEFAMNKLDETDYYSKIYTQVKSNFEKYIYQSGLEESVLENIITEEQVKNDTQLIISNIYDGKQDNINLEEMKNRLLNNIENSLGGVANNQKEAVNEFIQAIEDEYSGTIAHFKYENQINSVYKKARKYDAVAKNVSIVIIISSIIVIILLNIKELYKLILSIGISSFASGVTCLIINGYINLKISVVGITFLNNALSELLRNIATSILDSVKKQGIIFTISGITIILISGLLRTIIKEKQEME